jgi:hypothetical protein
MTDQSPTGLPRSLERFQGQLEAAAARDLKRSSRIRPTLVRVTAVCVTAAAAVAVLSVVGVFGNNGPSLVDKAAAALAPSQASILHIDMRGSQTNADGSVDTWSDESWQAGTKPYDRRQIEIGTEGTGSRVETATVDGVSQVYDPATDTIYVDTQAKPADTNAPTPSARAQQQLSAYPRIVSVGAASGGKVKVTIEAKAPDGTVKRSVQVIKKTDLKLLTAKLAIASGGAASGSGSASAGESPTASPGQDSFRSEILAVLHSGKVHEDGRPTVDGRDLIRFVANDGHATYLVDATTYDPVEWKTTGDGGSTTLRFVTYEQISVPDGNADASAVLSLTAQHPGARVDRDPAHFAEATGRLFPNG